MATKNRYDFLEESLGDMNEENTLSIDKTSTELEQNVIRNKSKSAEKKAPKLFNKSQKEERNLESYTPQIRKLIRRVETDEFPNLDSSMRFDKETIKSLKAVCGELDIAAYKVVTILIRDFLQKYKE